GSKSGLMFGDTAVRSLFDDEGELGAIVSTNGVATYLKDTAVQTALSGIAVEYAGLLAANKETGSSGEFDTTGYEKGAFFYDEEKNELVADFSRSLWTENGAQHGAANHQADIAGKKALTDAVLQ